MEYTDFRLVLLNKLLEDGNTLYRKGRLKEAAYRYTYALNKFPPEHELDPTFRQLQINFYLNTSRCKRKLNVSARTIGVLKRKRVLRSILLRFFFFFLNDEICIWQEVDESVEYAEKVLKLKPSSFEAYYARAKALKDLRCVHFFSILF